METTPRFLLPVLLHPMLTALLPPSPHPNKARAELELWGGSLRTARAPGDSLGTCASAYLHTCAQRACVIGSVALVYTCVVSVIVCADVRATGSARLLKS